MLFASTVVDDDERDGRVTPRERAQQQAVVLRFADLGFAVCVDVRTVGRPVGREEEGFLQFAAAEDGVAEGEGGALGEKEVFWGKVGEDEFEEFDGEGGGVERVRRGGHCGRCGVYVWVGEGW